MYDVLVIGGGVAGLQAAVFTAKANLDTLVLDNDRPLVRSTDIIQNLVTHETVAGDEIIETGHERVADLGGAVETATVTALNRDSTPGPLAATTEDSAEYTGQRVIVATAGEFDYLDPLDDELTYESGREGEFTMERHLQTDDANRATDGVYAAGLANTWEYQTAVAIGDGATAAVNLVSDLRDEAHIDHDW